MTVPSSTGPYTQKPFPVEERLGFTAGALNNRTVYNHMVDLVPKLPAEDVEQDSRGGVGFHRELLSRRIWLSNSAKCSSQSNYNQTIGSLLDFNLQAFPEVQTATSL